MLHTCPSATFEFLEKAGVRSDDALPLNEVEANKMQTQQNENIGRETASDKSTRTYIVRCISHIRTPLMLYLPFDVRCLDFADVAEIQGGASPRGS